MYFLALPGSLHLGIAQQLLSVQRQMRERVWQAAHVGLKAVTLDTDTTVHTLFGQQMGGRKGYHPKNKGKKSACPAKAGMFSGKQTHRGKSQKPRSLDSRREGN